MKGVQSSEDSKNVAKGKLKMTSVAAVFVPDWNKYVRGVIRRKEKDDQFCVWAMDYGVPMLVKASNIVQLPLSFKGKTLKNKRIFMGGIENCLPAESTYDIDTACSVKVQLSNWAPKAIELTQKILNQSVKLDFEHVDEITVSDSRTHYFGRLMMQRQDGHMVNVVKCLLDMNMATLFNGDFKSELLKIESLYQPVYHTIDGHILDTKLIVSPKNMVHNETGFTDDEDSDDEVSDDEVNNGFPSAEDNDFFNDSVSMCQPIKRNSLDITNQLKDLQMNDEEIDGKEQQIVANENANEASAKSPHRSNETIKDAKSDTSKGGVQNKSESSVKTSKCESQNHNNKQKPPNCATSDNRWKRSKNRNRIQNQRPTNQNQFIPQQARFDQRHANHSLSLSRQNNRTYGPRRETDFEAIIGKRPPTYASLQCPPMYFDGRQPMDENMPNHSMMNPNLNPNLNSPLKMLDASNNYNHRNQYNGPKNHTRPRRSRWQPET